MKTNTILITFGVIALALIGFLAWSAGLFEKQTPLPPATTFVTTPTTTSTGGTIVSCPSGASTNGKVRYEDTAASTVTYAASVVSYLQYLSGGDSNTQKLVTMANTSSSDYSAATAVDCNSLLPIVYRPIAVEHKKGDVTAYGYSSAISEQKTISGATLFADFKGKRTDLLKATIKDKANQDKYLNVTSVGKRLSTNGQGYEALNGTWSDPAPETSLTIGADGYMDLEISIKTNNTRNVFGSIDPTTGKAIVFDGKPLRVILAIDADASDWAEPTISGGGVTKIEKSALESDDQTVLSGSEYFYVVNPILDTDTIYRFYMQSKSAVNPDMDPILRWCAEGLYKSSDVGDTIKKGCFDDSSSNSELTVASTIDRHSITIDVT